MSKVRELGSGLIRWSPVIELARSEGWSVVKCDAQSLVLRKPGWPPIASGQAAPLVLPLHGNARSRRS